MRSWGCLDALALALECGAELWTADQKLAKKCQFEWMHVVQ